MTVKSKKTFKTKVGDKEVSIDVRPPTHKQKTESDIVYAAAFKRATDGGVPVQAKMEMVMIDQGLWSTDKRAKYEVLLKRLSEAEKKLLAGGNAGLTKSKARELALQMRWDRIDLQVLAAERNQLYANTAEAFAEQAKFDHLVSICTVYGDTGKPVFASTDDYLGRTDDDEVALSAAKAMQSIQYNVEERDAALKDLPENRFLIKYGFANAEGHLINAEGKLIDSMGRLVNEKGDWVDASGNPVDAEGNPLTESGDFKVEFAEFLEEEEPKTAPTE
jgi:hypothetical protein